jgi:hypothetical protein
MMDHILSENVNISDGDGKDGGGMVRDIDPPIACRTTAQVS